MSIANYQPPVSELLNYGKCLPSAEWPDYVRTLNLEPKHIPELLQMVTDEELANADSESPEVWSSVHAWRALGQLKAVSALPTLLGCLNRDNDWLSDELPIVCTLMGLETIPFLEEFLADDSQDFFARLDAASSLIALYEQHPELRASVIAAIVGELEKFEDNDSEFNALLICLLLDLKAIESIETIERAFQADRVETVVSGDWEDVQIEFGLKSPDDFPSVRESHKRFLTFLSPQPSRQKSKGFGSTSLPPQKKKDSKSVKKKKKR